MKIYIVISVSSKKEAEWCGSMWGGRWALPFQRLFHLHFQSRLHTHIFYSLLNVVTNNLDYKDEWKDDF